MRLIQIVPLYDSYCVFLRELTNSLLEDGHEVLTLCRTGPENTILFDTKKDATCRDFPMPRGSNPFRHVRASGELRKVIRDFRPDIVHAHFSAAILTASLCRSRRRSDPKWIGTFQGLQFPYAKGFKGWLTRKAECFSASRLDEAWVLTDDDTKALGDAAPSANVFTQKSPGFGCQDRFLDTPLPDQQQRAQLRAENGLSEENIVFIFIGRLVDFKGFHLAARAFIEAHKTRPQIRWIVIGELDPLHPTSLSDSEWNAFKNHEAITWLRTQADVLPWLDIADAMLFPTTREGMPVSVMEALARRVPVLTNRVRGCRELIEDSVNGRFFREPSAQAIHTTIESFQPIDVPAPDSRLRRSIWVSEMRSVYGV